MDEASDISSLTKIRVHGLKRKASSTVRLKQKKFKSDDTCSELSMTTAEAFGIKKVTDDFDLDDYQPSIGSTVKPVEFIRLDTSQLNRDNGVLFSENLTDYEVWTLQCPDDIDINNLLSQSISFENVKKLEIKNTMSDKVDLIPYRSEEGTNITIVTPSESTSNLSLNVVPLAGTLIMCNRVKNDKLSNNTLLPVDTIEDATRRRSELMSKITKRLSNKFDFNSIDNNSVKQEIKIEKETPKKVKKKKKLINENDFSIEAIVVGIVDINYTNFILCKIHYLSSFQKNDS
ncbi:uncharacterized protein LOC113558563 [Rhopalosiphum maidis]|uniref:uncharacterized protein LOC113558563 n=1 Tax=Rhopalosiphum maidis TaxID=43146 RepID=UPI000EFFF235|nr:uncharacterized protein LOC113558563 [Rhopalosiphum maidis]